MFVFDDWCLQVLEGRVVWKKLGAVGCGFYASCDSRRVEVKSHTSDICHKGFVAGMSITGVSANVLSSITTHVLTYDVTFKTHTVERLSMGIFQATIGTKQYME
jgi:hypothetical protein